MYRGNAVYDPPPGGNGSGSLDAGETADLTVALKNVGLAGVAGLCGVLRTADQYVTVTDSTGAYGDLAPDSTRSNDADRFRVVAAGNTPLGHECSFTVLLSGTDYADTIQFSILVGALRNVDPIPDGPREPALYWAYDDKDTLYAEHPHYSWVEIRTQGTMLSFAHNDAVIVVDLPSGFGPFYYYGQRYTQISVSADGWIVPGSYTTTNFTNTELPSSLAPPGAICPNWDDLYPGYSSIGYAYYFHDAANHQFVVEYDSVKYYDNVIREKFEIIFYDTTLASPSGNTVFEFQYMTANACGSNTVGIQDQGSLVAIQALFNGTYNRGCWPLAPLRAVRFTTDAPTGLAEEAPATRSPSTLAVSPNPFSRGTFVQYVAPTACRMEFGAFDPSGRQVERVVFDAAKGSGRYFWQPRGLAPGIYFLKVRLPGQESVAKVLLLD